MENSPSLRQLLAYGVWVVSMGIGLIATYLIVYGWLDTDLERYRLVYFGLTAFSIGIILVIWLDYFLDTKILPE